MRGASGPRRRHPGVGCAGGRRCSTTSTGRPTAGSPAAGRNTCHNAIDLHVEVGRGYQVALRDDSPVTGSVTRLPKTRSDKILLGTMRKIADVDRYRVPSTIDRPSILGGIRNALPGLGE